MRNKIISLLTGLFLILLSSSVFGHHPETPDEILSWIDAKIDWRATMKGVFDQEPEGVRDYDVQHYDLHLIPNFDTNTMAGEVEIHALGSVDALQVITIDMGNKIEADAVLCGGVAVNYLHDGNVLEITLDRAYDIDELITVYIAYHGKPPSWTFNFAQHNGVPVFSTMAEPEGGRQWWPCNDVPWDKATVDLRATVPDWMFVAANGLLTEDIDNGDETHTVKWETDYLTSTYLVAAAGTNYETIMFEYIPTGSTEAMPVPVYTYPELLENSRTGFEDTVDMIRFFSENFGEYPFLQEKYGQVLVPIGGGMEHQTITHINAYYLQGGGKPNSLIAHELAHMWWGDYITMSDWPHIWLNESFATYSDALYHEYANGTEYLKALCRSYRNQDYEGSIYDPVYLFDRIVYTKGAFVMHMLRRTVGEDNFWTILQTYYQDQRFAYSNASTAQFREICETVSGQDLEWFFDQWIFGTKRPTIQYSWDYEPAAQGTGFATTVDLEQVQQDLPLFKIELDVAVETVDGSTIETLWVENANHSLQITTDSPPLNIVLDPNVWALAHFQMAPEQFQFGAQNKLPAAHFGEIYQGSLGLAGGQPPYTMELLEGELPMGITLDLVTGDLSGFPLEKGNSSFTVRASDSRTNPRYTEKQFSMKCLYPQAEVTVAPDNSQYVGGETMTVSLELSSNSEETVNTILYILLEVEGLFYFLDVHGDTYPQFSEETAGIELEIPFEFQLETEILAIPLPQNLPVLSGGWWGLLINSETGAAAGPVSMETFEFI